MLHTLAKFGFRVTDDAWRAEDDLSVEVGANAEADATIDRMEMALENFMVIYNLYCSPKEEVMR